jgi:membrane protein
MWQRAHGRLERWLFNGSGGELLTQRLRRLTRYPYALLRDLAGGQLNLHAMGLVYATLLAIVPLLAFSFAVLRMFGAHRELEPLIFEFFRPMGAAAGEMTQRVMAYAESVRAGLVGSLGLALLIWTSISTLKKVEDSLNFVWHVEESRSFPRRLAEYLSLLVIGPLLVVTVIGLSQLAMRSHSAQLLVRLPLLGQLHTISLQLAPFAVVSVLFTLVYVLAPNTRVRWWPALVGGLAAGCLWAAIGSIFTTFVVFSARLTIVYAGLAILVAALVWTYLGWLILLLGAQLSFYVQNPNYLRIGLRIPRLSNNETEQLSLGVMFLIGESHLSGAARWTINGLATRLGLPGIVVAQCVRAMESAGLLVSTEKEALVPARELSMIRVVDVLSVARSHHTALQGQALVIPAVVAALCNELDAGWRASCGERTMRDLLAIHPQ